MILSFRNVDAQPSDPVESWPYEAVVSAIERGTISDWAKITAAIRRRPWGEVSRALEEYLVYAEQSGVAELLRRAIRQARDEAERSDREEVAARVREMIRESGLTAAAFASHVGTSASRLSTYASGRVVPSAAMMLRLERVAAEEQQLG